MSERVLPLELLPVELQLTIEQIIKYENMSESEKFSFIYFSNFTNNKLTEIEIDIITQYKNDSEKLLKFFELTERTFEQYISILKKEANLDLHAVMLMHCYTLLDKQIKEAIENENNIKTILINNITNVSNIIENILVIEHVQEKINGLSNILKLIEAINSIEKKKNRKIF